MVTPALLDYEGDIEDDFDDFEMDAYDEDEFLRDWLGRSNWVKKVRSSPGLRSAVKAGLAGGGGALGLGLSSYGKRRASPYAGVVGSALGGALGNWIFDPFEEDSDWGETFELGDDESDTEVVAQMEQLGYMASTTPSEAEADAFIGALIPLASKLIPKAASVVKRVAPTLIRGATRVARQLRRSPATRTLVRTMPTIVRHATRQLARRASRGRPPSRPAARRVIRRSASRVLRSRRNTAAALRRCTMMNRRLRMMNRALMMRLRRAQISSRRGRRAA